MQELYLSWLLVYHCCHVQFVKRLPCLAGAKDNACQNREWNHTRQEHRMFMTWATQYCTFPFTVVTTLRSIYYVIHVLPSCETFSSTVVTTLGSISYVIHVLPSCETFSSTVVTTLNTIYNIIHVLPSCETFSNTVVTTLRSLSCHPCAAILWDFIISPLWVTVTMSSMCCHLVRFTDLL